MEISDAAAADLPAILELQKLAYRSEAILYSDWSLPALTQTIESITEEFHTSRFIKAVMDGTIVGSVRADSTEGKCEVGRLIVHPEHQRKGIGSKLLLRIEALFPDSHHYELFTGSKSVGNIKLYQKHGYTLGRLKALSDAVSIVYLDKFPASSS